MMKITMGSSVVMVCDGGYGDASNDDDADDCTYADAGDSGDDADESGDDDGV